MSILVTLVISGALASLALWAMKRLYEKRLKSVTTQSTEELENEIASLDKRIKAAVENLSELGSGKDLEQLSVEVLVARDRILSSKSHVEEIESNLRAREIEVDRRERQHNSLKVETSESSDLVDEIKARAEQLSVEKERIHLHLLESQSQMLSLESEVELTQAQQQALAEISASLKSLGEQVQMLAASHHTASDRYVSLQKQYVELEREYRRLIEQQLNAANNA